MSFINLPVWYNFDIILYDRERVMAEKVYTRLYMNKLEGFSEAVATFNHVGGSFNLFMATTGDVWIIPFSNLAVCAVCSAHFRCHHELWPTSVSHPFSSLSSSLCFAGGKRCQKFTIPIFRLVLFFPDFLQVGLSLQYVALFQSGN